MSSRAKGPKGPVGKPEPGAKRAPAALSDASPLTKVLALHRDAGNSAIALAMRGGSMSYPGALDQAIMQRQVSGTVAPPFNPVVAGPGSRKWDERIERSMSTDVLSPPRRARFARPRGSAAWRAFAVQALVLVLIAAFLGWVAVLSKMDVVLKGSNMPPSASANVLRAAAEAPGHSCGESFRPLRMPDRESSCCRCR